MILKRRLRYVFVFTAVAVTCMYWSERVASQSIFASIPISWIAISFLIVAYAYLTANPSVLRKSPKGTLPLLMKILLLPYLLLNSLLLTLLSRFSSENPADEIQDGMYLGRRLFEREVRKILPDSVATIDLTAEFEESKILRNHAYLCIPTLDTLEPSIEQIEQAISFIETHRCSSKIYVHCAMGHGRSATVVAAWLISHKKLTVQEAINHLQERRPLVDLHEEQKALLHQFAQKQNA